MKPVSRAALVLACARCRNRRCPGARLRAGHAARRGGALHHPVHRRPARHGGRVDRARRRADGSHATSVGQGAAIIDVNLTPAEALGPATIVPARLVGMDKETGSIAVGKAADLVLVAGDPSRTVGDLRIRSWVAMDGKLKDAAKLRAAVGIAGRPFFAFDAQK